MINRNGSLPLYHQVRLELENRIRDGSLVAGERLAPEHELCRQFGVSRITVRQALQALVHQGALQRTPGRGTFVTGPPSQRFAVGLAVFGFEEEVYRRQPEIFGELISGVTRGLQDETVFLRLLHFPTVADPAARLRDVLARERIDGFLVRTYGDLTGAQAAALDALGVPYVLIKRSIPDAAVNCVVSDDVAGAACAVRHLLALGHRRIGLVLGPPQMSIWRQRRAGYERALRDAGLGIEEDLIAECGTPLEEDGRVGAGRLLDGAHPPTALFVASDLMALGVYEAAHERGLRIPDQLSVVGYDGFQFGAHLRPPLTTIRTRYFEFGAEAIRLLVRLMTGATYPRARVEIKTELVERGSTRQIGDGEVARRVRRHPAHASSP